MNRETVLMNYVVLNPILFPTLEKRGLQSKHFRYEHNRSLWKAIKKSWEMYKAAPSPEELKNHKFVLLEHENLQTPLQDAVAEVMHDYYKRSIEEALVLLGQSSQSEISDDMRGALQKTLEDGTAKRRIIELDLKWTPLSRQNL